MTQKDLGKALLRLGVTELSGLPDVREQTWSILERDRRRVRRLTVMTVAAWLLSTVLILTVLVAFGFLFPSVAKLRMDVEQGKVTQAQREQLRNAARPRADEGHAPDRLLGRRPDLRGDLHRTAEPEHARATLRQINASLLEISDQLKELRSATARSPG